MYGYDNNVIILCVIISTPFDSVAERSLDEHFSLTAFVKLEHGCDVPILSELRANKLWKLKEKAVFGLMMDKHRSDEPAVDVYLNSWLEDKNAGCRPTWKNLVMLLEEIGLEGLAKGILEVLSTNVLLNDLHNIIIPGGLHNYVNLIRLMIWGRVTALSYIPRS